MNSRIGLGDLAYWAFRPAVYGIDWVWGTDLKDCDRCKERRAKWNAAASVPRWLAIILALSMSTAIIWWRRES